jgi:hypothetical protein
MQWSGFREDHWIQNLSFSQAEQIRCQFHGYAQEIWASVIPGRGANSELVVEDQWFGRMESNKLNGASRDYAVVSLYSILLNECG